MLLQRAVAARGRAGRPADIQVCLRSYLEYVNRRATAATAPSRIRERRSVFTTTGASLEHNVEPAAVAALNGSDGQDDASSSNNTKPNSAGGHGRGRDGSLRSFDRTQDRNSETRQGDTVIAETRNKVAATRMGPAALTPTVSSSVPTGAGVGDRGGGGGGSAAATASGVLTTVTCVDDGEWRVGGGSDGDAQQQQQQKQPRPTRASSSPALPKGSGDGTTQQGTGTARGEGAGQDAVVFGGGGGSSSSVGVNSCNSTSVKDAEAGTAMVTAAAGGGGASNNSNGAPPPPPAAAAAAADHHDVGGFREGDPNPNPTTEAYDDAWDRVVGVGDAVGSVPLGNSVTAVDDAHATDTSAATVGDGGGGGVEGVVARSGEERAHKMWVTMTGGKAVSEHEWEADGGTGGAKEDTAVIQFHSPEESIQSPFQGFGVIKEDKVEDIQTLVDSFTAPALAAALRDRETALHICARLLEKGDLPALKHALNPFTAQQVATSRRALRRLDLDPEGFTKVHMYTLQKVLHRLPRHVTTLTEQRASVMIPLCNVDGVASVLFTKRSGSLRSHGNEVCFPGGKVDIGLDHHIIHTALREMGEEIGITESSVDVLGVLRCDWSEVASLIGVAVTPVVGFLGNLSREQIHPNPDEVSHCFTIPIRYLLRQDRWKTEKYKAPAFVGGPYVIWGLTGYILHRLVNDVLLKHLVIV